MFLLTDAWQEAQLNRKVFKFRLELDASELNLEFASDVELESTRIIPSMVKLEVWKRDDGKCVLCGVADNLHYDHDVPYSKGGSSLTAKNIRLLCDLRVVWPPEIPKRGSLESHCRQLGIAFFEYCFQVPANRTGSYEFSTAQLRPSRK
jgi:hypothetical protein